jgi:hypothetical protein
MRCPECQKFVAFEDGEPEVDFDVENAQLTGTVRIVLLCAECSTELKESQFDVEKEFYEEAEAAIVAAALLKNITLTDEERKALDPDEWDYEVDGDSTEQTMEMQATETKTKKNGEVVTRTLPLRFQKKLYGFHSDVTVSITATIKETEITASVDIEVADQIPASSMDEMV